MDLATVKQIAQVGDALLCHDTDLTGRLIEKVTTGAFCHAAMIVIPNPGQILVSEMMQPAGYACMTIDDWFNERLQRGQKLFFGVAPKEVHDNPAPIMDRLQRYVDQKNRGYDFTALPLVWLSDITGKSYVTRGEVCSLFVQNCWEIATGVDIPGNASPSDFLYLCDSVALIR